MPDQVAKPFPVMVDVEFLDRLSEPVREGLAKSVSVIIRDALARFDFANVVVMHPAQVQISVRLPGEIRRNLRKVSRSKHTSIGQLVRAAVEAYLPQLEAIAPLEKPPAAKKRKPKPKPKRRPSAGGKKSPARKPRK
jgi:Arc/MetJ-type ribon-helix-helix transcriptional regulator